MSDSWINFYVKKISGIYFDEVLLDSVIEEQIKSINESIETIDVRPAVYDKKTRVIKLPDCYVEISIENNQVTFDKFKEKNHYKGGIVLSSTADGYKYSWEGTNKVFSEKQAIKHALELVLVYVD